MNFVSALLYPIALLLPAAGATPVDSSPVDSVAPAPVPVQAWPELPPSLREQDGTFSASDFGGVEPAPGWQVRIEQRMQIRITPRAALPMRRDMFFGMPDEDVEVHYHERKIGKCLAIGGIAGVQPNRGNRLLLYMRDRRLIVAEVERACRARDFYSGFYLARSEDGQLCVDRDSLLSRSGMNCKLTRIRQLVESDR